MRMRAIKDFLKLFKPGEMLESLKKNKLQRRWLNLKKLSNHGNTNRMTQRRAHSSPTSVETLISNSAPSPPGKKEESKQKLAAPKSRAGTATDSTH